MVEHGLTTSAEPVSQPAIGSLYLLGAPIAALIVALYGHILVDLALEWWTVPAASQGLLIPPFALYVAWMRRHAVAEIPAQLDVRGLAMVTAACLFLLTGRLGAEFFLMRISFVIVLAGLVWTFWGHSRLSALGFPFLLLATMIPLPSLIYSNLAAPLQLLVSRIAASVAEAAGVTLFRDGNVIYLASITLGVEEACSGLSSLSSLLVAGVLFGFLLCRRIITRSLVFLLATPIAVLTNAVRVTGTAILSDSYPSAATGFYHAFSGWAVFVVGVVALYGTTQLLRRVLER